MKKVLFVNACVRGENSRTLKLANVYLEGLRKNRDVVIVERNLSNEKLGFMTCDSFPVETGEQVPMDPGLADEFASADEIVLAAPYWEFLFPAVVNCYFEAVSIAGHTFKYTESGSVGLCKANSLTYIYTAGDYIKDDDKISEKYLEKLTKLYGIEDFSSIYLGGLDIYGNDVEQMMMEKCREIEQVQK